MEKILSLFSWGDSFVINLIDIKLSIYERDFVMQSFLTILKYFCCFETDFFIVYVFAVIVFIISVEDTS